MSQKSSPLPQAPLHHLLQATPVPPGAIALVWLGQAGFLLKSPQGKILALDPYLSNSCQAIGAPIGVNMDRQIPIPMQPEELIDFSALIFTHSHQDHVDPETLQPYLKAGGVGPFIAPHDASDRLRALGIPEKQILLTWPNHIHRIGDFTIKATLAIPLGPDDLNHVGYLIEVQDGPLLYFTGDTDYNEILSLQVAPSSPDILITVINPAFRNLSPATAAKLAKEVNPKRVIPCHHDLFPDNCLPDRLLKTNLMMQGIVDTFCPLNHGEIRIFSDAKKRQPLA
jgi:L-ascorbate 6-phosphate lactonase